MWELKVVPLLSVVLNALENQVRQIRKCLLTKKSWVFFNHFLGIERGGGGILR